MQWKRSLHRQHNTKLIETYSYQQAEGNLRECLRTVLQANGVKFSPIPREQLLDRLNELGTIDTFSELLARFLVLHKARDITFSDLQALAKASKGSRRATAFVNIFKDVFEEYQEYLEATGDIDFEDMIIRTIQHVRSGRYSSPYDHILVDEFQDIAPDRARLIKALKQQKVGSRLFAVGDDWQSIYRFTGSDISLMTGFAEHFGYTERVILDETFRFNNSIAQVSSGFITKNPHQINKSLITREEVDSPRVFLGAFSSMPKGVTEALKHISKLHGRRKAHVFVLGRYWHSRPKGLKPIAEKHKKLTVEFRTVHSAKGLEADYVVVVDMAAGKYGFPCEIADDPIIDMMLTRPEGFPHAEERRLLYTAITRAKKAAYLLASAGAPSVFLEELDTDEAGTDRLLAYGDLASRCPECRSGSLVKRTGKNWIFFGCSNYPYCEYTTNGCPRCKTGKMVPRRGRHGRFWGCSNYSEGCRFTAKMSPSDEVLAPD